MRAKSVAFLALITSVCACDPGSFLPPPPPAPQPSTPPQPKVVTLDAEWLPPSYEELPWREFKFSYSSYNITGKVYGFGAAYSIDLHDCPEGTPYEVGGQKGTITSSILETIRVDVKDKLANVDVNDKLMMVDPGFVLKLVFGGYYVSGGEQVEVKLAPAPFRNDLWLGLKEIEKGPVLFGNEPEDPKKSDSVVTSFNEKSVLLFGHAGKLSEVDYIALFRMLPEKSTKVCGGYSDQYNLPAGSITVSLRETELSLYDRRTGEVVEKKIFAPNSSCPKTLYLAPGEDTISSGLPDKAIETWLKTKVKS